MNLYRTQKSRQQEQVNNFLKEYAFFAFDKEQYRKGLQKLGLTEAEAEQLTPIGSGGYLLQDKVKNYISLLQSFSRERQAAIDDPETGLQFAIDMFYTALVNTEYGYTREPGEALQALGYSQEEIAASPVLSTAFDIAEQKAR